MLERESEVTSIRPFENELTIRAATLEEVQTFFIHVWKTVYNEGVCPALLDPGRLSECDEFFVAECDGEIIGAVTLAGLKNKRLPTLDALYVVPTHRGRRVGPRLCETALLRFKETQKTQ
jgi:N-acetylglutamate synthase-like GNAT family acetyltransferase